MNEEIGGKVESVLGESFESERVEHGLNSIYRISSGERKFILKVHTNEKLDGENFRAEPLIYDRIEEETEIPSPSVIHEELDEEKDSFYIMEFIEGENPGTKKKELDLETLENLIFEYGRVLGEIHRELDFESFGELEGGEEELKIEREFDNWSDSLEDIFKVYRNIIEDEWSEPPPLETPNTSIDIIPNNPDPSLIHVDNRLDNLLIEGKQIEGFIDWSFTRTGHGEYDLVRAEYLLIDYDLRFLSEDKKDILRTALFEGYSEEVDLETDSKFEDRREIYRYATIFWLAAGFQNWGSELEEDMYQEMRQLIVDSLKKEKPKKP